MKKTKYSKFIVAIVILLNVMFSAGVLVIFKETGTEPVTLIGCWFAFTTGELWMLASIKKIEKKERKDDKEDEMDNK